MAKISTVDIVDNSASLLSAVQSQVLLGLESIGKEAEGYAKEECPVDTSRLRNSISHEVADEENAVYIGTNVEYAVYVEFNEAAHHKVGKAHFLRDAAGNHTEHYKAILEAVLETSLS